MSSAIDLPETDLVGARRAAVVAAMALDDLDVLVLGRQDDVTYASGIERLWTAGTRPFGAGCVIVRDGDPFGRVHVMSSWNAGIPDSIPFDDLLPLSWNPATIARNLRAIPGLGEARRIGVDTWSPGFTRTIARLAPHAELVAADDVLERVRRHKLPAEIDHIRAACEVAWAGVDAILAAHRNGTTSSDQLTAAAIAALATHGATIPSSGIEVSVDGEALVADVGMIVGDYEGGVGGRFVDGVRVEERSALIDACVTGASWHELAAAATTGHWRVRGLGLGYERPVFDATTGRAETLAAAMVMSVADGSRRDVVAIRPAGPPEVLSARSGSAP